VHVHLDRPGAAVEAALAVGELSQIRITALEASAARKRTVVAVVSGPGLARAVRDTGAVPVGSGHRPALAELEDVLSGLEGDVLVLPNDPETQAAATLLLQTLRSEHRPGQPARRLVVLPTHAQVQGLAALAVHEPEADFDAVVAAMSVAAGHARHGEVRRADEGTSVHGLLEGAVVEVGTAVADVAGRLADRLLRAGGELLTVVVGEEAPAGLAEELGSQVRRRHPAVEVQVLDGGQPDALVLLGAE
jgi:uncharacterized protein